MMNTRCTKLSMVRDDSKLSKTSNKKCPVVLHGDHIYTGEYSELDSIIHRAAEIGRDQHKRAV